MMFMNKKDPPVLINDFIKSKLNHCTSRRPVEKAFEELSKRVVTQRNVCVTVLIYTAYLNI